MINWPSNAISLLFHSRLLRFLVFEVVALLASVIVVIATGGVAASIASYIYDMSHAIPDPVARGEDMGSGLVMVGAALGSSLVSLPITVLIHIYVFKKIFLRSNKHE